MGEQRSRNRVCSGIDKLPEELHRQVDAMLLDTSNTYLQISEWLKEQGYEISRSAVGRYALRSNDITARLQEAQSYTQAIVEAIRRNPDSDYTEGALQIMAGELTKRLALAQEEWDELSIEKAAKLMVALSRTKVYKDKIRTELSDKLQVAISQVKAELAKELMEYPELLRRLEEVVDGQMEHVFDDSPLEAPYFDFWGYVEDWRNISF